MCASRIPPPTLCEPSARPSLNTTRQPASPGSKSFAADVRPPLPAGLRFEDKYQQQHLEGQVSNYYWFGIRLRGDAAALNRIRSVEYQLPQSHFSRPRVVGNAAIEYMIDGSMPGDAFSI